MNKKDLGIHSFFVQIRNTKTHEILPGVYIGDVGPKMGNPAIDSGYLKLMNLRIPRTHLLSRFSEVLENGIYHGINPGDHKIITKFLVFRRINFTRDSVIPLVNALTIAIRYSCFRKQFRTYPNDPTKERPVIEYQMQQVKLFSLLADVYAMIFASKHLLSIYNSALDNEMNIINALSLAYKAMFTENATSGIEVCRQACGGHGFLSFSGLPFLYTTNLIKKSQEGENNVILNNAGNILINYIENKQYTSLARIFKENIEGMLIDEDISTQIFHQSCFKTILILCAREVEERVRTIKEKHVIKEDDIIFSHTHISALSLTHYFCNYYIHEAFCSFIDTFPAQFRPALENLRQIWSYNKILKTLGILLKNQIISKETVENMRKEKENAIRKLRGDAVSLIEGFDVEDEVLLSVLGRKDGEVYETLYKLSKDMNPINTQPVFPGIKQLIKPLAKL